MRDQSPHRITRRQFLIGAGAALVGSALACGRGRVSETGAPTSASGTGVPVLTPVPTEPPPIQIAPVAPPEQAADMAFVGGKVITVDSADTIAQAVAVKDGLIQAVGTTDQVAALVGESTQMVELGHRTITPGMIDSHNHFQVMGLMSSYYAPFLPPDVVTVDQLRDRLAEQTEEEAKPKKERATVVKMASTQLTLFDMLGAQA